jgi:hypothetical protein
MQLFTQENAVAVYVRMYDNEKRVKQAGIKW